MKQVGLFLLCSLLLQAADWPRFRGVNGEGVSPDRPLPTEIGKDRNVAWKVATPKGNSSPIVANGRLWITGYEGDDRVLLCYDANTGALKWRRNVTKARTEAANPLNGPTTPTPTTDGGSVFVFYPEFGLLAYDLDGKEQWRVPMGPFGGVQGMAVSPVYVEGLVILLIDTPEQAYLAAFDASTGKQAWQTHRPIGFLGSYATPSVYKPATGATQIVVAGAIELAGYDAKTGARIWWARGVTYAPATLPLVVGDSVYTMEPVSTDEVPPFSRVFGKYDKEKTGKVEISKINGEDSGDKIMLRIAKSIDKQAGNGDGVVTEEEYIAAFRANSGAGGLVRTRLGGKGDVTQTHVAWRYKKGLPYTTSPLFYNGALYVVRDGGILNIINPETGELLQQARLKDAGGAYYAQPVAGDGKIYFMNHDGKLTVIRTEPGAKWEQIWAADLGESVIATPAISGACIYVRTAGTLYSFNAKAKAALP